ncbi:GAF domain-containing protein, partial [Kamptonema sp. PCC 6506]|uniref:GAF domain-containing protein n=2 Tax=Kamptonema TaxID=1501433 RepID=UPI000587C2D8
MINSQGNQDFARAHSRMAKPLTLHLHAGQEPVLLQKFMGRLMQNQTDPAQLGQQISQILLANLVPETVLPKIAEVLGAACQGDCCLVAALKSDRAEIQTGYWEMDRTVDSTEISQLPKITPVNKFLVSLTERPAFGKMLLGGRSVAIADIQTREVSSTLDIEGESLPFRGMLAIATRLGGVINGTIVIGSVQPRVWSVLDLERLEAIATMAAIAISQLEKTQQITTLQQAVHRQSQYQTLLSWLTCIIDTPLELNQILQLAIEGTADTLQVDRGSIALLKYTDPLFKTHSPNQIPKAKVTIVCEWS